MKEIKIMKTTVNTLVGYHSYHRYQSCITFIVWMLLIILSVMVSTGCLFEIKLMKFITKLNKINRPVSLSPEQFRARVQHCKVSVN